MEKEFVPDIVTFAKMYSDKYPDKYLSEKRAINFALSPGNKYNPKSKDMLSELISYYSFIGNRIKNANEIYLRLDKENRDRIDREEQERLDNERRKKEEEKRKWKQDQDEWNEHFRQEKPRNKQQNDDWEGPKDWKYYRSKMNDEEPNKSKEQKEKEKREADERYKKFWEDHNRQQQQEQQQQNSINNYLYEVLGVDKNATKRDIIKAWQRRALENHPDKFNDPIQKREQEEVMKEINKAKEYLSDDVLRSEYDKTGKYSGGRGKKIKKKFGGDDVANLNYQDWLGFLYNKLNEESLFYKYLNLPNASKDINEFNNLMKKDLIVRQKMFDYIINIYKNIPTSSEVLKKGERFALNDILMSINHNCNTTRTINSYEIQSNVKCIRTKIEKLLYEYDPIIYEMYVRNGDLDDDNGFLNKTGGKSKKTRVSRRSNYSVKRVHKRSYRKSVKHIKRIKSKSRHKLSWRKSSKRKQSYHKRR